MRVAFHESQPAGFAPKNHKHVEEILVRSRIYLSEDMIFTKTDNTSQRFVAEGY